MRTRATHPIAAAALLALAACSDVSAPAPDAASPPVTVTAEYRCTAYVRMAKTDCRPVLPETGGARASIILGNLSVVGLTSANTTVAFDTFATDVRVINRIPQPIGTTDGVTVDPEGIRVFFNMGPTVTQASGSPAAVVVANADGEDAFLASNQKYFLYDQLLAPGDTSNARRWKFHLTPTVESFSFIVLVSAPVQFPEGWIVVSPPSDSLALGDTVSLTADPVDYAGTPVPGGSLTWSSSDPGVATVDATGLVTGIAPGSVTITVTQPAGPGTRSGSAVVEVF